MTVNPKPLHGSPATPEGLRQYYVAKVEKLQLTVAERTQNLRRLQAQRNELNAKVRMLSEELQLLVSIPHILYKGGSLKIRDRQDERIIFFISIKKF